MKEETWPISGLPEGKRFLSAQEVFKVAESISDILEQINTYYSKKAQKEGWPSAAGLDDFGD